MRPHAGTPLSQLAVTIAFHLTPLRGCGQAGDGVLPYVRCLLRAGADVHAADKHGLTPLHRAAASGAPRAVAVIKV